ncbi:carbon storage regulator [Salinisphaera aquimarina]|uniref:Carbon storage regulator n=1 Tax=Salinisphaera aquimarina TaxID=2094031 RepID=A0ABV7EN69_9GAMM
MLIIERRAGELIQIGDEIQLCVLDADGDTVRIGVSVPRDVPVTAMDGAAESPSLAEQGGADTPARREDENSEDKQSGSRGLPGAG